MRSKPIPNHEITMAELYKGSFAKANKSKKGNRNMPSILLMIKTMKVYESVALLTLNNQPVIFNPINFTT
jgi:hypothetical protein